MKAEPHAPTYLFPAAPQATWIDDEALQDATLDVAGVHVPVVFDPEVGYIIQDPYGAFAIDAGVRILTMAVGILPRSWKTIEVRVEHNGGLRTAVVDVAPLDGESIHRAYE